MEAWFEDEAGTRRTSCPSGRPCSFAMRARFLEDVDDPIFGVTLLTGEDETVLGSPRSGRAAAGPLPAGEEATFRAPSTTSSRPDRYHASPAIAHAGSGLSWIDRRERFVELVVTRHYQTGALVELPCKLTLDRAPATPRRRARWRSERRGGRADEAARASRPGPSAMGGDWRRLVHLTRLLAVTDFRLRFFGSALGYLWQVMHPLLLFGVLYLVFTEVVRLGEDVRFYPVVLLPASSCSCSCPNRRPGGPEPRRSGADRPQDPVPAPRCTALNRADRAVPAWAQPGGRGRVPPGVRRRGAPSWLEAPFLIAALAILAVGLATLLSALYVNLRDVKPIWDVVLQVLFYGTPIFYTIEVIPSQTLRELIMLDPVRRDRAAVPPCGHRPEQPERLRRNGRLCAILIPPSLIVMIATLGLRTSTARHRGSRRSSDVRNRLAGAGDARQRPGDPRRAPGALPHGRAR